MHAEGNIRYTNFQSEDQMSVYLTNNCLSDSITKIISYKERGVELGLFSSI